MNRGLVAVGRHHSYEQPYVRPLKTLGTAHHHYV